MSTPDFSAPVSGHRKCFQSGAARSFEVAGEAVDRLAGDDERPRRAPMDVLPRNRTSAMPLIKRRNLAASSRCINGGNTFAPDLRLSV